MTDPDRTAAPFCSLDAKSLGERIAMVRQEILPHARESHALAHGWAWEFADTPAMKTRLERFVALERECCRDGVSFHLVEDAARGALRLEVRGLDPDAELFGAAGGSPVRPRPGA